MRRESAAYAHRLFDRRAAEMALRIAQDAATMRSEAAHARTLSPMTARFPVGGRSSSHTAASSTPKRALAPVVSTGLRAPAGQGWG
jgi:hypothetical protein